MTNSFYLLASLVALTLISPLSAFDENRPESVLRQDVSIQSDRYVITFNRFIPSQIVQFYAPNAVAIFPGSDPIVGRENFTGAFAGLFSTRPTLQFTSTNITLDGDRRYIQNNTFLVNFVVDGTPGTRTGKINWIWEFIGPRPYIVEDVTISD